MRFLLPLLLAALPAFSDTITVDNSIPRLFQNIEVKLNGSTVSANAGQIGVLLNGTDPMLMYCADPLSWLLAGPTAVTSVLDTDFTNGARLAWLFNTYNPIITQGYEAAALQLAIWEVILDNNNDNLSAGNTRTTSNTNAQIVSVANAMLLASAGQSSTGLTFWIPNQGPGYSQTLLSATPQNTDTPEPASYFLLGAGLLLLSAVRRR